MFKKCGPILAISKSSVFIRIFELNKLSQTRWTLPGNDHDHDLVLANCE
jgi:hypothetical protein